MSGLVGGGRGCSSRSHRSKSNTVTELPALWAGPWPGIWPLGQHPRKGIGLASSYSKDSETLGTEVSQALKCCGLVIG